MEKFASAEEQIKWFLVAHRRDGVKLIDELNILLERDCGDFKLFLRNEILPDSEIVYCDFMNLFGSHINSVKDLNKLFCNSLAIINDALDRYFKYCGGCFDTYEDDLHNFSGLSPISRNALIHHGLKTRDGVIDFIENNGGTSNCLKKIFGIGKYESVKICRALGIAEYISNNDSSISDIERLKKVKKYLEEGGTDIDKIKALMGGYSLISKIVVSPDSNKLEETSVSN